MTPRSQTPGCQAHREVFENLVDLTPRKIQYLGEINTEFEHILTCLSRDQMGLNHEKKGRKSRDTLP